MNIFIYGIYVILFAVNLSNGNVVPLKSNIFSLTRDSVRSINDLLEDIRNRMCHDIPNKGIPKLDPFGLDKYKLIIEEDMAQLDIDISKLSAAGLAKFDFQKLKIIMGTMKIDLHLVLPKIVLTTNYKVKGTVTDLFDLNGNGNLTLEVDKIELKLVANVKFNSEVLSLKISKLDFSIQNILFRISNLFPDDELNEFVGNMVSDLGVGIITDMWNEQKENAITLIETLVTNLLEEVTIEDLIKMITNVGGFFDENDPPGNCTFNDLLKTPQAAVLLH